MCKDISQSHFYSAMGKNHFLGREKILPAQEKIFLCAGKNKSGARRSSDLSCTTILFVNKVYVFIRQISLLMVMLFRLVYQTNGYPFDNKNANQWLAQWAI